MLFKYIFNFKNIYPNTQIIHQNNEFIKKNFRNIYISNGNIKLQYRNNNTISNNTPTNNTSTNNTPTNNNTRINNTPSNNNYKKQFINNLKKIEMHESHSIKPFLYIKSDRIK